MGPLSSLMGQAGAQPQSPAPQQQGNVLNNLLGFLFGGNTLQKLAGGGQMGGGMGTVMNQDPSYIQKAVNDYMAQQKDAQSTALQSTNSKSLPKAILAAPAKKKASK